MSSCLHKSRHAISQNSLSIFVLGVTGLALWTRTLHQSMWNEVLATWRTKNSFNTSRSTGVFLPLCVCSWAFTPREHVFGSACHGTVSRGQEFELLHRIVHDLSNSLLSGKNIKPQYNAYAHLASHVFLEYENSRELYEIPSHLDTFAMSWPFGHLRLLYYMLLSALGCDTSTAALPNISMLSAIIRLLELLKNHFPCL